MRLGLKRHYIRNMRQTLGQPCVSINHVIIKQRNGDLLYLSAMPYSQFKVYEGPTILKLGNPLESPVDDEYNIVHYATENGPVTKISLDVFYKTVPLQCYISNMQCGEVLNHNGVYYWMQVGDVVFNTGGEAWAAQAEALEE